MKRLHIERKSNILCVAVGAALMLSGCASTTKAERTPMPEVAISANTQLLTDQELAFINASDELVLYNLTPEKLAVKLAEKSPQEAKQLVQALMQTSAQRRYQANHTASKATPAEGIEEPLAYLADSDIIPLNPKAGGYNRQRVLQPALFDRYKREPGPFSLKRYLNEEGGIPTFANAPVAIRKADLVAGAVDVAFVGVPLALGSGWRDDKHAPTLLRGMYGLSGYSVEGGIDPTLVMQVADYGNIAVDNMSPELNIEHITQQLTDMLEAGTIPFIVGGDHSIMFSSVSAVAGHFSDTPVSVLHLDAHYRGERDKDHFYSDEQSVANLLEASVIEGENLIQVGLRGASQNKSALMWLRENSVKYHTMAQVERDSWPVVMEQALTELSASAGKTFVSFDMSVVDPAFVSGSGQPVAGGISVRQAMTLVRRACAETEVAGFEMLGVAPFLDLSYNTALSANQIMHACLTGIAMRKSGMDNANYIDPMALSHQ